MDIRVVHSPVTDVSSDALVVGIFESASAPEGPGARVDEALGGMIAGLVSEGEVKGKLGATSLLHTQGKLAARKVIVSGLGKRDSFDPEAARKAAAAAAKRATGAGCTSVASLLHRPGVEAVSASEAARAVVEGTILGTYVFSGYKKEDDSGGDKQLGEFTLVETDASNLEAVEKAAGLGRLLAGVTNHARDLGNMPANKLTPSAFAGEARSLAERTGLGYDVLDRADMEREGMELLLSVAKGSDEPPKLIVLTYEPDGEPTGTLALVGKAITFDSGGLSLKPGSGMERMKGDMCGGAAVCGAMEAIAQLKPRKKVIGLICATENMPGGHAQRPGDVWRGLAGKTVEILNTDAEGRLVLADGVAYAEKLGADSIVDIATLTGAVVVALGRQAAGVVGNNQELIDEVTAAGKRAGERYWQLPSWPEYREQYKSDVADLKNIGGREAGTITGGLIIGEFVEHADWAHLDIAAMNWSDKDNGYNKKGATGFGVRTLAELALADDE